MLTYVIMLMQTYGIIEFWLDNLVSLFLGGKWRF